MLIRFIVKHKSGLSAQAVHFKQPIKILQSTGKQLDLADKPNVQWFVVDEKGDEYFQTEEQFKSFFDVQDVKMTCVPNCKTLELRRSNEDWNLASSLLLYRCNECGCWYTAQKP